MGNTGYEELILFLILAICSSFYLCVCIVNLRFIRRKVKVSEIGACNHIAKIKPQLSIVGMLSAHLILAVQRWH